MEPNADGTTTWTSNEAKTRFSALLDRVTWAGPQRITRSGTEVAVLIRADAWRESNSGGGRGLAGLLDPSIPRLNLAEIDALLRRDPSIARPVAFRSSVPTQAASQP